ncbi:hypothetical protein JL721_2419 [Aureococcus anophagefferens]|nr:hypothetical protein JL721_2419 [Aureococcus anophagefferens]
MMRLRLALALVLRVAGASYYDNASLSKHLDDVVPTFPRLPDAGLRKRSPFVVVATQRTGSKWIMKTLRRQTCDVDAESELFTDNHGWDQYNHREAIKAIFDQSLPLPAADGRHVVAQRFINRTRREDGLGPVAYGFKWMLNQGMAEQWPWFLWGARAKLVFLHRRDFLRMAISTKNLKNTALEAHPETEADLEAIRHSLVHLATGQDLLEELGKYAAKFALMDAYRSDASRAGVETYRLVYEDIAADHTMFHDVRDFLVKDLDLARAPPAAMPRQPTDVVIHSNRPSAYVANWRAVEATLRGSRYQHLLGEDEPGGGLDT